MDHLKIALTHVATLSERRTFRLTYGQLSRGLPSFLVPGTGINSGFMLAQYTAASLTSECKGLAHPASVDTIPTVQHHEDHVSMGPIAARGALRILECVADVLAIEAILSAQALDLRERGLAWDKDNSKVDAVPVTLAPEVRRLKEVVRAQIPFWEDDDVLHPLLQRSGGLVRAGAFTRATGQW
jgi:histidine ammonia-lyase